MIKHLIKKGKEFQVKVKAIVVEVVNIAIQKDLKAKVEAKILLQVKKALKK